MTESSAGRSAEGSWQRFLAILRCPLSGSSLRLEGSELVSDTGHRYPIVRGKPILVERPTRLNLERPADEKVSQTIDEFRIPPQYSNDTKLALHLGSGNVRCDDSRVVSCDLLPNDNVDIVVDAQRLPFASACFDYVESGAAFEHLPDPLAAIKEVKRVLRPGGYMLINTGFLCAYHGYPGHFFNMTPQAVETHLLDDFFIEQSIVPDSATPATAVLGIVELLLEYLPTARRNELLSLPLRGVLATLRNSQGKETALMRELSEYAMRALCATYLVAGRKPERYEERRDAFGTPQLARAWAEKKIAYYAARTGVIFRHHEVDHYRRLAAEYSNAAFDIPMGRDLQEILSGAVADPLSIEELDRCTRSLNAAEAELGTLRDRWLVQYLTLEQSQRVVADVLPRLDLSRALDSSLPEDDLVADPSGSDAAVDDVFRGDDMVSRRESLAARFLRGSGIEIGALHKPLKVPDGVIVRYVDYKTLEANRARYPELSGEAIVETDIVDDGFVLRHFEDASLDFIVANHAIEHSPDPYGTLLSWARKVRPGGILYFAVPVAEKCFDKGRPLASVQHLLSDHTDFLAGDVNRLLSTTYAHLLDFMQVSDRAIRVANGLNPMTESEARDFAGRLVAGLASRLDAAEATYDARISAFVESLNKLYDVHYHAFSPTSLHRFLREVARREGFFDLEAFEKSGSGEVIAVVRVTTQAS